MKTTLCTAFASLVLASLVLAALVLAASSPSFAQTETEPPPPATEARPAPLTEAVVARCYRAVYAGLRPIARVRVPERVRDDVLFGVIARAPCPGWDPPIRRIATLARRFSDHRHLLLLGLLADHEDHACTPMAAGSARACAPHDVRVRGVDATQRLEGVDELPRLVLVRALDALCAHEELVPLAQLLWGFGNYDGGCETWDVASMHDDVRRGRPRRALYRPPPGHTREELAAR